MELQVVGGTDQIEHSSSFSKATAPITDMSLQAPLNNQSTEDLSEDDDIAPTTPMLATAPEVVKMLQTLSKCCVVLSNTCCSCPSSFSFTLLLQIGSVKSRTSQQRSLQNRLSSSSQPSAGGELLLASSGSSSSETSPHHQAVDNDVPQAATTASDQQQPTEDAAQAAMSEQRPMAKSRVEHSQSYEEPRVIATEGMEDIEARLETAVTLSSLPPRYSMTADSLRGSVESEPVFGLSSIPSQPQTPQGSYQRSVGSSSSIDQSSSKYSGTCVDWWEGSSHPLATIYQLHQI